jgi:hypothetical protein
MKTIVVALVIALVTLGCNAQDHSVKEKAKAGKGENTKNQPKESWTVKKEMDENGNVIGYDSTYTWSYTNTEGDSVSVDADSVMQSFRSYFSEQMPSLWGQSFIDPFMNDSLQDHDFFAEDYFHKRWEKDIFDMDKMFRQMDSLRNQFFNEAMPGMQEMPSTRPGKKH